MRVAWLMCATTGKYTLKELLLMDFFCKASVEAVGLQDPLKVKTVPIKCLLT